MGLEFGFSATYANFGSRFCLFAYLTYNKSAEAPKSSWLFIWNWKINNGSRICSFSYLLCRFSEGLLPSFILLFSFNLLFIFKWYFLLFLKKNLLFSISTTIFNYWYFLLFSFFIDTTFFFPHSLLFLRIPFFSFQKAVFLTILPSLLFPRTHHTVLCFIENFRALTYLPNYQISFNYGWPLA